MKTAITLRVFSVLLFILVFALGLFCLMPSLLGSLSAGVSTDMLAAGGAIAMIVVWIVGSVPPLILLALARIIVLLVKRSDYY
jgi:hypothetical protein